MYISGGVILEIRVVLHLGKYSIYYKYFDF